MFTIIFIAAGASYLNAWTSPTQTAPNGNTPAPLNVGTTTQDKIGILRTIGFKSWGPAVIASSTVDTYLLPTSLLFGVNGNVGAKQYCDENGQNCSSTTYNRRTIADILVGETGWPTHIVCSGGGEVAFEIRTFTPNYPNYAGGLVMYYNTGSGYVLYLEKDTKKIKYSQYSGNCAVEKTISDLDQAGVTVYY